MVTASRDWAMTWAVIELWPSRDWAVTSPWLSCDLAVTELWPSLAVTEPWSLGPGAVTTVVTVSSTWAHGDHLFSHASHRIACSHIHAARALSDDWVSLQYWRRTTQHVIIIHQIDRSKYILYGILRKRSNETNETFKRSNNYQIWEWHAVKAQLPVKRKTKEILILGFDSESGQEFRTFLWKRTK